MSNEGMDANGCMKHSPVKKGEGLGVGVLGGERRRGVLKPEEQPSTEQGARTRSAGTWEVVGHAAAGALPSACGEDPAF